MYIDPREHRRRTWRIVGRILLLEFILPSALIVAAIFALSWIVELWNAAPWLIVALAGLVVVCGAGFHIWSCAEDKARKELKQEHTDKLWRVEQESRRNTQ